MKRAPIITLGIIGLGLAVLCIVQWKRETEFRAAIHTVSGNLQKEGKAREEAERKAAALVEEINRLTTLRAETEARYLAAAEELQGLKQDSTARGWTILSLSQLLENAMAEAAALRGAGESVVEQNASIASQNAALKKLAAERDSAITRLNASTRDYNELVRKYNALTGKKD